MSMGVGPQINKFEEVSSDDHQMSVAVEGEGPMSGIQGVGEGGSSHVWYLARGKWGPCPNASWVMVTWGPLELNDRHL